MQHHGRWGSPSLSRRPLQGGQASLPDAAPVQIAQRCRPRSSEDAAQWQVLKPTAHLFHHGLQPLCRVLRRCPHAWQTHDQLLLLPRGQWLLLHMQPAPNLAVTLLEALLTSGNRNTPELVTFSCREAASM